MIYDILFQFVFRKSHLHILVLESAFYSCHLAIGSAGFKPLTHYSCQNFGTSYTLKDKYLVDTLFRVYSLYGAIIFTLKF